MNVLVACEFSGIVRTAFEALGHTAMSADLLPTEMSGTGEPWSGQHYRGDVLNILRGWWGYEHGSRRQTWLTWDLCIAHVPCTFLANSGVRWLYGGKGREPDLARWHQMELAATFFAAFLNAPIPRVAVENPIMHGIGRETVEEQVHKPFERQTIQPWQFGHPETKATVLWTRGLPPLQPTDIVEGRTPRVHHASPGPDRWKERSRTLPGIAAAMAAQWGAVR